MAYREPVGIEDVPLPPGGGYTPELLLPEARETLVARRKETLRQVIEARVLVYSQIQADPGVMPFVLERCRRSCVYFINMFAYTYDDREGAGSVPFVLKDYQEEKIVKPYLDLCNVQAPGRITVIVAKSRDMGFSWVSLIARLWRWLFYDNWSILIGGENRRDVDDGGQAATQQSLFGKLRFMIDHLPEQMVDMLLGPMFGKEEHNKLMFFKNPMKPCNIIIGKQLGAMFGRSGRFAEAWADEVAHAKEMENAETAIKQTTNRFTAGSTPKGRGNFLDQAMFGPLRFKRYWLWWAEDSAKDIEWYNAQREEMTDDDIAQELDISFDRSVGNRVLHEVTLEKWFTEAAKFDPSLPLTVIMDPGWSDNFACVWAQWDRTNGQGRVVDFVCTNRKTVDWIVPFILGAVPERTHYGEPWPHAYNQYEMAIIGRHAGWVASAGGVDSMEILGDDAGKAKNVVTGSSAWDELEHYEIYVEGVRILDDKEAIRRLNIMMRFIRFSPNLLTQRNGPKDQSPTMGEVVTQWRYRKGKRGESVSDKPVHNVYSHGGDCLKMWADVLEIPDAKQQPVSSGRAVKILGPSVIEPTHAQAAGPWR